VQKKTVKKIQPSGLQDLPMKDNILDVNFFSPA